MENHILLSLLSKERISPYLKKHNNNYEKALEHYKANIRISASFYPLIAIIEVVFRNNVNQQLTRKYNSQLWFDTPEFRKDCSKFQLKKIRELKNNKSLKGKSYSPGKIVSELTFGFWTSLFDSELSLILWKSLRLSFPNCPKPLRHRKEISRRFTGIRKFRNRIFHHEPISWDYAVLQNYYSEMLCVILWLNKDLPDWVGDLIKAKQVILHQKQHLPE
jgi:hypothetical protein